MAAPTPAGILIPKGNGANDPDYLMLGYRINKLPLVLAGPIVRLITASRFTVWFALQRQVSLIEIEVFANPAGVASEVSFVPDIGAPVCGATHYEEIKLLRRLYLYYYVCQCRLSRFFCL